MPAAVTSRPRPRRGPASPGRHPARRPAPHDRRWLRWLRVVALVIVLPVVALGIGLLVAWIVHQVRGNPRCRGATRSAPQPSASAARLAPPSSATAHASSVPADWVAEVRPAGGPDVPPPAGLDPAHRAARRSCASHRLRRVDDPRRRGRRRGHRAERRLRLRPCSSSSRRAYGEPAAVAAAAPSRPWPGAHPGELQEVVTYVAWRGAGSRRRARLQRPAAERRDRRARPGGERPARTRAAELRGRCGGLASAQLADVRHAVSSETLRSSVTGSQRHRGRPALSRTHAL